MKQARALLEHVRDYAIFLLDREGNVRSWNNGAKAIKQYEANEKAGEPMRQALSGRAQSAGAGALGLEAEGANRLVMIVEDDRDVRDSVREALEDHGYQTVGASQGKEALELLRSSAAKPCIILLDMMMPVMDGWAFRKAQTADPALSSIPVIVLTAHSSASDTARDMGAVGFLRKPVTLQELLTAVKQECPDAA